MDAAAAKSAALARHQKSVRVGGRGAPRRSAARRPQTVASCGKGEHSLIEDKKIQALLKRSKGQKVAKVLETNMFRDDGTVINIANPEVHVSLGSNMFVIAGDTSEKKLANILPSVLGQLGNQSGRILQPVINQFGGMEAVKSIAGDPSALFKAATGNSLPGATESYPETNKSLCAAAADDEVPELIGNFDDELD